MNPETPSQSRPIPENITMKGSRMLWGRPLDTWQLVVFWLWAIAAVTGGIAVTTSFLSSVLSYFISKEAEKEAAIEITKGQALAAEANERASLANERTALLERDKVRLERRLVMSTRPRALSDEQCNSITKALKPLIPRLDGKLSVASASDSECNQLASSFITLFRSGGIKLVNPGPDATAYQITVQRILEHDLFIRFKPGEANESLALELRGKLHDSGIRTNCGPDPRPFEGELQLIVCPRTFED